MVLNCVNDGVTTFVRTMFCICIKICTLSYVYVYLKSLL
jgi:hypothetical protein